MILIFAPPAPEAEILEALRHEYPHFTFFVLTAEVPAGDVLAADQRALPSPGAVTGEGGRGDGGVARGTPAAGPATLIPKKG